jgi:hypothetical protein
MVFKKERFRNWLIVLLVFICLITITEIGMRIFLKQRLRIWRGNERLRYRHDDNLGWFPSENSKVRLYNGSRLFSFEHNSRGFRDSEHLIDARPRIVFLGDSYVWGYDVEKSERFTEKLHSKLPDWSVYNLGVTGYSTDQEYLLLKKHYDFYRPDIVFLMFCRNDDAGNSHNAYSGVYKPYFVSNGDNLELRGVPVPKSKYNFFANHDILVHSYWFRLIAMVYFKFTKPPLIKSKVPPTHVIITKMHEFINGRGAQLIIGSEIQHLELERFLKEKKIPYIDLANSYRYPARGKHWTPEGHSWVSEKILDFLKKENYLKMVTVPNEQSPGN